MAFQYLTVKVCIKFQGDVSSYSNAQAFHDALSAVLDKKKHADADVNTDIDVFWSIYGVKVDHTEARIADFDSAKDAMIVLNSLLAPMVKIRDALQEAAVAPLPNVHSKALRIATDFINQSSNEERF